MNKIGRNIRVIPRLDIKGPNLVKGIHLEGLRVLGKPEHFARYYYESGADDDQYYTVWRKRNKTLALKPYIDAKTVCQAF